MKAAPAWTAGVLLVSLIGCILPRLASYTRALRSPPPKTPRNLVRLPVYAAADLAEEDHTVLDRAADQLRRHRYRIRRDGDAVAAERGYLREAGNLVFHLSVVALLLGSPSTRCCSSAATSSSWPVKGSPTTSPSTTTSPPAPGSPRPGCPRSA